MEAAIAPKPHSQVVGVFPGPAVVCNVLASAPSSIFGFKVIPLPAACFGIGRLALANGSELAKSRNNFGPRDLEGCQFSLFQRSDL
jgi:hypothetical protein